LTMALIWALSSVSTPVSLDDFPLRDKGAHFLEYGLLGLLVAHAVRRTWPRHHPARTLALAVVVTVLFGLLDEIHQAFVPGRSSDALDLVADGAGALVGALARHAGHLTRRRLARDAPTPEAASIAERR